MLKTGLLITLVIIAGLIYTYNKAVQYKNYVAEAFATMDVYLKKRWDLLPNLLETVKQYTAYEKGILTDVTKIRAQNYANLSLHDKINTNVELSNLLPKINAIAENYPDLKSNQTYILLMQQMSDIENDIANSRKYYNGTVRELNTFLQIFPINILTAACGFKQAEMFEISADERRNIKVE